MTSRRLITIAALLAAAFFPSCNSDLKRRNEDLANQVHQNEVELNQAKAERDEARNREENLQRQVAAARDEARIAKENATVVQTQAQDAMAKNEKTEKTEKVTPVEAKNVNRAEDQKAMAKKLTSSLAARKIAVDATKDGKVRLVLPLGDSFNSGSAELNADGKKLVKDVAASILKDVSADAHLTIVGHTDSDPIKKSKAKYSDNKALSLARAKEVMAELKSFGVSQKRMSAEGLGETQPVAASGKPDKAKDRRVEILID